MSHPIDTTGYAMADVLFGINDAMDTTVLIYNETGEVVEKTGNLIEYKHYTTDDKVGYYINIDEYNSLKATGGTITSSQELLYIGSRELIGDPLNTEELKATYITYIQKRGDEYAIEGAEAGYFNNYNTILLYDYYLDQKLGLINLGVGSLSITDSDEINLSRTLKQGDNNALSIQLQDGYDMLEKQANKTQSTSCKSATIYWELKLSGAAVGTYSNYLDVNVKNGNINEKSAKVNVETNIITRQYDTNEYEYRAKIITNYDSYIAGDGGERGETRIVKDYGANDESKRHSIMTHSSDDDEARLISDTGDRGYGEPAQKVIKSNNGKQEQYFKYYEYIEKKPKIINNKEKSN